MKFLIKLYNDLQEKCSKNCFGGIIGNLRQKLASDRMLAR